MEDEPGHKAMLYFLELLMENPNALTISQMAGRFGSRNFTAEMRTAAGGNEAGLKRFLQKYPSLFTVTGNMVSAKALLDITGGLTLGTRSYFDDEEDIEVEAVKYFEEKMMRKEDKWIPVKSLAGHLSQASSGVRQYVGPQSEFKKFLLRHPNVFDVTEEIVSLQETIGPRNYQPKKIVSHAHEFNVSEEPLPDVESPAIKRQGFGKPSPKIPEIPEVPQTLSRQLSAPGKKSPITITANEYKALTFVKGIVEKRGSVKMHNITGHFSQAPESVRNTIGWTKYELEEFIKLHPEIFLISQDGDVTVKKSSRLNVVITGSKPLASAVQTLNAHKGKIYHVAKLWGIVDLGKHEHVFFDRSIYHKESDDLQRDFQVGEWLYFNAVLAPKKSRAKWRATHIWKEGEVEPVRHRTHIRNDSVGSSTESGTSDKADMTELDSESCEALRKDKQTIEDEISQLLPKRDPDLETMTTSTSSEVTDHTENSLYSDAAHSRAGAIPVWNFMPYLSKPASVIKLNDSDLDNGLDIHSLPGPTIAMVPESYFMHLSCIGDVAKFKGFVLIPPPEGNMCNGTSSHDSPQINGGDACMNKMVDASCQTISTGDILTSQLYYGDKG